MFTLCLYMPDIFRASIHLIPVLILQVGTIIPSYRGGKLSLRLKDFPKVTIFISGRIQARQQDLSIIRFSSFILFSFSL